MNGNLGAAFVVNSAFFVMVEVTRIPLLLTGGWVAIAWPEGGVLWHVSYSLGMIVVALLLLAWTLLLPCGVMNSAHVIRGMLTATAALNLALCMGTLGALTSMTMGSFADTPSNRAIRAKHELRKASQPARETFPNRETPCPASAASLD